MWVHVLFTLLNTILWRLTIYLIRDSSYSKTVAVVKRRVDKALPQDFKDKQKEGKEKEKEKTAAANSSAAANTSSKPIA